MQSIETNRPYVLIACEVASKRLLCEQSTYKGAIQLRQAQLHNFSDKLEYNTIHDKKHNTMITYNTVLEVVVISRILMLKT